MQAQATLESETTSKSGPAQSNKKKNKTNKGMSKKQRDKAAKDAIATATPATAVLTSVALNPTTPATQPFAGAASEASASGSGIFNSQTGVAVSSNGPAWFTGNRAERRRRRFGTGGLQTPLQQAEAPSSDYAHLSEEAGEAGADASPDLHAGNPLNHVQASLPSPPPSSPLGRNVVDEKALRGRLSTSDCRPIRGQPFTIATSTPIQLFSPAARVLVMQALQLSAVA